MTLVDWSLGKTDGNILMTLPFSPSFAGGDWTWTDRVNAPAVTMPNVSTTEQTVRHRCLPAIGVKGNRHAIVHRDWIFAARFASYAEPKTIDPSVICPSENLGTGQ